MEEQLSMFQKIKYRFSKPIRLIELFSGYGSQALALKYLGIPFEHWKICEWAIKSIQAYKDIHYPDAEMQIDMSRHEMIDFLFSKGISSNYNKSLTLKQVENLSDEQMERIIGNILITHNLVDVSKVKGKDLEIYDTDKYSYVLTYSFPCQDVSLGGHLKGYSDTSTRSGLLWEVVRILEECKELGAMPEVLLMENVPMIHSNKYFADFKKLLNKLSELGYSNYWKDLSATDFGVPQTRTRTFVVSILGDYEYQFPNAVELRKVLNDFLEDDVDDKYYLPEDKINEITFDDRREHHLNIKNATRKGFLEAYEGDGVDISGRMQYHRGTCQKGKAQTLNTTGGENGGVVCRRI